MSSRSRAITGSESAQGSLIQAPFSVVSLSTIGLALPFQPLTEQTVCTAGTADRHHLTKRNPFKSQQNQRQNFDHLWLAPCWSEHQRSRCSGQVLQAISKVRALMQAQHLIAKLLAHEIPGQFTFGKMNCPIVPIIAR